MKCDAIDVPLVPADKLQAASGLEATAMGAANVLGPAIGAGLITLFGAPNVLLLDAATYLLFAFLISRIKAPMGRPEPAETTGDAPQRPGWAPVFRLIVRDRFLLVLTLSFGAFNVSAGALVVALPWLDELRAAILSGAALWSQWLAWRVAGQYAGGIRRMAATSCTLTAAGLILAGWILLLWIW